MGAIEDYMAWAQANQRPIMIPPAAPGPVPVAESAPVVMPPPPTAPAPAPVVMAPPQPSIGDEIRATLADPQARRMLGNGLGKAGGPAAAAYPQPPPPAEAAAQPPPPAPLDPKDLKFVTPAAPGAQGAASSAPVITWGGGGGAAIVPAHEARAVSEPREAAKNEAIDAEGRAVEEQKKAAVASADAAENTDLAKAEGLKGEAKTASDAATEAKARTAKSKADAKALRAHIDEFSAQIAKDKIDPNGMWNNSTTGQKIAWTLAKAFGAVGQGFLKTPTNQIADHIDAMAVADVQAQRLNHETGRERVQDMNSMYAQALRATGDAEEAEKVATGYALEAAKKQTDAFAASAHSKEQKARGPELSAAFAEKQAQLGEKKADFGIAAHPYVQAHAAAGGNAPPTMKELAEIANKYVEHQATLGNTVSPDEALRYAIKIRTTQDPLGAAGRGVPFAGGAKGGKPGEMTPEQAGKIAQERQETQTAADEFNRQMNNIRKHPIITGSGLTDAALSNLPQRVAPASNDAQQQLEGINTQMLQAIGKVAKDADGKPNKAMVEKIEKRFELHLGDAPAIKQQKLNGIADVYNALAREQGAKAPEPNVPVPTKPVDPTFKKE